MPHNFPRRLRVAEIVREEVADGLIGVCPGSLLTVRGVDMAADLSVAVVRYSMLGAEPEQVQETLDSMSGKLRTRLARRLRMRRVPKMRFVADLPPNDD